MSNHGKFFEWSGHRYKYERTNQDGKKLFWHCVDYNRAKGCLARLWTDAENNKFLSYGKSEKPHTCQDVFRQQPNENDDSDEVDDRPVNHHPNNRQPLNNSNYKRSADKRKTIAGSGTCSTSSGSKENCDLATKQYVDAKVDALCTRVMQLELGSIRSSQSSRQEKAVLSSAEEVSEFSGEGGGGGGKFLSKNDEGVGAGLGDWRSTLGSSRKQNVVETGVQKWPSSAAITTASEFTKVHPSKLWNSASSSSRLSTEPKPTLHHLTSPLPIDKVEPVQVASGGRKKKAAAPAKFDALPSDVANVELPLSYFTGFRKLYEEALREKKEETPTESAKHHEYLSSEDDNDDPANYTAPHDEWED